MTERSVAHAGFTLTREFPVPVERVFAAFAEPDQKRVWFVDAGSWTPSAASLDFRVGGQEIAEGRFHSGVHSRFVATYTDIVEDERIVLGYDMWIDGRHISTSVASYEFEPIDGGTRLTHAEHGIHLDGIDDGEMREAGTKEILDNLYAWITG